YRQAIDTGDPEYRSLARFGLAEYLLGRGESAAAEELFRQELGPDPGHPRAALGLGQIARARNDDEAAERFLRVARDSPHARKPATALLAALAARRGDEAAARAFEAESKDAGVRPWPDPLVSQMLPLNVGAQGRERRAESLERQGRYAEAHEEYTKLLALDRSPKVLARAATNLARLNNFAEATSLAREAAAGDPADANARYTLALVLYTGLEDELKRNPAPPRLGEVCRESIAEARRATELKPDLARAYLLWGLALKQLGDPKAAVSPIRTGLTHRPDDIELLVGLGQSLAASGDRAGATAAFEEAQKAKPTDPRPGRELAKLRGK
ncbi:MAG: tetratricopeptide repeat protein, partial [Gemmataceae bacterium]|nr:tetratricopeptide repeat protein [Gemmataceae bacterium]